MIWKKWIILGVLIFAFGIYAVLTGGIAIDNVRDFGGQRNIRLVKGIQSDVWLAPRMSNFGIPYVFHYFGTAGPFDLRLQIWDESKEYAAIEIIHVLVEYNDGEVFERSEPWSCNLKPYTQRHSTSKGLVETEMLAFSSNIERLVLRHADFKVTLKGHLVKVNGDLVHFASSEVFKAESRFEVGTFWNAMAGC
jgi:hypothetical protein